VEQGISQIANLITIISGTMTILGVSGFLTWSIFSGKDGLLSERLLSIFAYSIKSAMCLAVIPFIGMLIFFPWIFAVGFAGGDPNLLPFSGKEFPIGNYIGTFIIAMFSVPAYIILCSCIFEWSFKPISRFVKTFSKKDNV